MATAQPSCLPPFVAWPHRFLRRWNSAELLFGMDTAAATPPDVAFFEQLHTERGYRRPKYPTPAWIRAMLRARSGETAKPITLTGRV